MVKKKTCFKCGRRLPLSEFYPHPMMADGHLGKCKRCSCADTRAHREANHAAVCAYDRARNATPERKRKKLQYRKRDRQRKSAWNSLARAIRDGRIVRQPCETCGYAQTEAHHDDYVRPLDVRWFCWRHHREIAHGQKVDIAGNDWRESAS